MKTFNNSAFSVVAFAVAITGLAASPVAAQGVGTAFLIAEVNAETPQCRDYPEFGFVGRVSGIVGGSPARGVSFTGCFPSIGACEAWKGPVSGKISGRLIQSSCDVRS
ncbi:hypothetical protein L1787_19520 [Acuticoccus sp. M5D2P5]|uniref:hypothetical protein n=1 Tax=Acuticoccus kalidii TaxID=2910977 RepID=UPI001F365732|nr:hypothetical protein [Acuticoccus kalidii]MCF3935586.1 hypothetical protein [Acuticoccus kalidii]